MPESGGRIHEPNGERFGVLQIAQSVRQLRLARGRILDDLDGRAAEPARAIERMEVRRIEHKDKRHENLNGGDRRNDRGADTGGEAKARKSLSHYAGCLIAWTWAVKT